MDLAADQGAQSREARQSVGNMSDPVRVGIVEALDRVEGRKLFSGDQVDVGRSLAADRRTRAKHRAPKGQKDRGD